MKTAFRRTIDVLLAAGFGLALLWSPAHCQAYNPPTDTAGPLTVKIEGPAELAQIDAPQKVRVVLENRHERRLEGVLELQVIDRWRVEPAGPVKFSVDARAKAVREFQVVAGPGTYSGHYPIHAFARFNLEGKEFAAHPILILQTRLPRPPRPAPAVEWKPFPLADGGQLALWRLPNARAVVAVFHEPPKTMPVGWQGSEPRTSGSFGVRPQSLAGQTREVVAIHPPYRDGLVGTLAAEYPIALPKSARVQLSFATAIVPDGQSDGVTFRVRVLPLDAPDGELGKVVFERHSAAKTWEPGEADLSAFAGRTVRLQLESHPGPKNNTGWDQSFWAEPVLTAGTPPEPPPFPPKHDLGSRLLGRVERGGKEFSVRVWPGRRGLLDSVVGFCDDNRRLYFRGFEVRVQGLRLDDPRSPVVLKEVVQTPPKTPTGRHEVRHRFDSPLGSFDLLGVLAVEQGVLRARFALENAPAPRPWLHVHIEDVACGPWSDTARQVYAGVGNVIRDPGPFRLGFDGHRLATSFVGFDFVNGISLVQGVDVPPEHLEIAPDARHYSLHVPHQSMMTLIPAANVWEAVKGWRATNGLKPAGGVKKSAGRFVFDVWGGRYRETAEALRRAFRYGLTDSMVIFHNWQRWGYDYRLPDIYPPNPQLGTIDDMKLLVETCRQAGVPFALHDNYIDFYPDAEGFSYEKHIAFHADGTPVRAWLNEGRNAQSYRYRADSIEPFLKRNLQWIREGLRPTAYFIDVWSSAGPYDYWTADGKFTDRIYTRNCWGEHFAWIRELLGDNAPQISESGHDQLIGWLDGAQTNHLRVGKPGTHGRHRWTVWDIPHGDAERTPWLDAAHHDRFILHGAGYPGRYEGGLDPREHGIYSDDYISTEVLTGHPGMVPRPFGRDEVRKYWLLADLARALALRQIESVEYVDGDLHRQHVRWSGGAEVWVNRGPADWTVEGTVLPQYGFLARSSTQDGKGTVEASIARRDGVIVEMARSPDRVYVNGRADAGGPLPIRLSVEKMSQGADRQFEFTVRWQADAPLPAGWSPFFHFCDEAGEIVFQANHQPSRFEADRRGTFTAPVVGWIPKEAKAGETYELRAGVYHPGTGERLALSGPDDHTHRIRLGTLRLEGTGNRVTGIAWTPHREEPDALLARMNPQGKLIDFGPVVTAAGCRLAREGDALVVTPLPDARAKPRDVRIRWSALPWKLPQATHAEARTEDGRVVDRKPLRREGDDVVLTLASEIFDYRLVQ